MKILKLMTVAFSFGIIQSAIADDLVGGGAAQPRLQIEKNYETGEKRVAIGNGIMVHTTGQRNKIAEAQAALDLLKNNKITIDEGGGDSVESDGKGNIVVHDRNDRDSVRIDGNSIRVDDR